MIKPGRLKYIVAGLVLLMALKCQSRALWELANGNKELLKNCVVVENFSDELVIVSLEFVKPIEAQKTLVLPPEGNVELSCSQGKLVFTKVTPRTLVVVEY